MKNTAKILAAAFAAVLFGLAVTYCANAGTLVEKPLDLDRIYDDNLAKAKTYVSGCNTVTVRIEDVNSYKTGVRVSFPDSDDPDLCGTLYVSESDAARLSDGDIIKVRGEMRYSRKTGSIWDSDTCTHYVSIGDPVAMPPCSFDAKVMEFVERED